MEPNRANMGELYGIYAAAAVATLAAARPPNSNVGYIDFLRSLLDTQEGRPVDPKVCGLGMGESAQYFSVLEDHCLVIRTPTQCTVPEVVVALMRPKPAKLEIVSLNDLAMK
ncbi:MAG: hypothetical protein AABX25_04000 [Nanoarchaeota archaeon]